MKNITTTTLPTIDAAGFTLVELLITITVMIILLVLVVPSFTTSIKNNRILAQTDEFSNGLNYARTTALNQNITVAVCPVTAAGSTTCGGNWATGWIVITQPAIGNPVLLQSHISGPNDPTLSSVTANGVAATNTVSFDALGLTTTPAIFKSCDNRAGTFGRSLEVLPTGFVQSSSAMGNAVWNGGALTCP